MSEFAPRYMHVRDHVLVLFLALFPAIGLIAADLPLFIAAGMALAYVLVVHRPKQDSAPQAAALTLATLLFSFWIFLTFVRLGWATWPMQRAHSATERLSLLYMQSVLLITLAPACLLYRAHNTPHHFMRWGQFRPGRRPLSILLWSGVAFAWSGSAIFSWQNLHEPFVHSVGVFAVIVSKAGLYTLTEEVCFRGVIMPAIARRNGMGFALFYQTALFTGFHLFLNPPISSQPVFLLCVAGLGALFGCITYTSRGIGWAWSCHWAIGVMVECSNLS